MPFGWRSNAQIVKGRPGSISGWGARTIIRGLAMSDLRDIHANLWKMSGRPPPPAPAPALAEAQTVTPREPPPPPPGDGFAKVRREASALASGHTGTLLWIDARCQSAGMHALDEWWVEKFREFYASGKLIFAARVGLRGAKSVSICRALVNDALFLDTQIDKSTKGAIPIMSADRTEATDRFTAIRKILSACGVSSKKAEDALDYRAGGVGTEFAPGSLQSGGGLIHTPDEQGKTSEFRIYPARMNGAIGYTAKSGLGDELDQWPADLGLDPDDIPTRQEGGVAFPADVVLDRWRERFTTTMKHGAHLYLVSASYHGEGTAHARVMKRGDTPIQFVARLGDLGAQRDTLARQELARAIGSDDRRLLEEADPRSMNVPAWVSCPVTRIEDCYAIAGSIGPMLGRYGGRPDENTSGNAIGRVSALPGRYADADPRREQRGRYRP